MRWLRNIILGLVGGIVATWCLYAVATGDYSLVFPVVLLLLTGVVAILAWLFGITRLSHYYIRRRADIILIYLEQAVRLNLPLPQMLLAAESSESGWIARGIARLRSRLESGVSIADALRTVLPASSRRTIALVDAAQRVGQVGPELHRLVADQQKQNERDSLERSFIRSYPGIMIIVITLVVSLIMTFVMPRFEMIFHDFKTRLPPLTMALIQFVDWVGSIGFLITGFCFALLLLIVQQIRNRTGGFRLFTSNRDMGDVCHVIAEALRAGVAMDVAIQSATTLSISRSLRAKLQKWAEHIEQGQSFPQAAQLAGLPTLLVGLTTTASTAAAVESFAFLSRYYTGKFSRLSIFLRAAVIPAMVFFFGIIVAFVALTLFLPLIALIDAVQPHAVSPWL